MGKIGKYFRHKHEHRITPIHPYEGGNNHTMIMICIKSLCDRMPFMNSVLSSLSMGSFGHGIGHHVQWHECGVKYFLKFMKIM